VRSQVFFTAQADHYGVARSPRLIEKSPFESGEVTGDGELQRSGIGKVGREDR
jgi:hypothetical protein